MPHCAASGRLAKIRLIHRAVALSLLLRFLLMLAALVAAGPFAHAKDSPAKQRATIQQTRDDVLADLYKLNPDA